ATRTRIDAGFAGIMISAPVAGLRPRRFFVAGRLTARTFNKPGNVNSPTPFLLMWRLINASSSSITESTCLRVSIVAVAISLRIPVFVIFLVTGPFGAAFFAAVFFAAFRLAAALMTVGRRAAALRTTLRLAGAFFFFAGAFLLAGAFFFAA